MKRWFSKFGPITWYHREWVRLSLSAGDKLLIDVTYSKRRIVVSIGGRVNHRSIFGSPSDISPWLWFALPDRSAYAKIGLCYSLGGHRG